jgi:hypothetical protein
MPPRKVGGTPLSYSEISPLDNTVKWSIELVDESGKIQFLLSQKKI